MEATARGGRRKNAAQRQDLQAALLLYTSLAVPPTPHLLTRLLLALLALAPSRRRYRVSSHSATPLHKRGAFRGRKPPSPPLLPLTTITTLHPTHPPLPRRLRPKRSGRSRS